jgi:heme A synthase
MGLRLESSTPAAHSLAERRTWVYWSAEMTTNDGEPETTKTAPRALVRYAWGVLAYVVLVIAWGAFVRATGSGAGCGRHWPLCNGEVVPRSPDLAMGIELSHRVTSGIAAFVLIPILAVWTFRAVPRGHRARRAAVWSTAFGLGEAVIGAGLVLFELVAHDASLKRGVSMVLHLDNTFLLLASLAATAWHLSRRRAPGAAGRGHAVIRAALLASFVGIVFVGSSGAIAALGDTLFPAASLREGIAQDMSPMAHAFLRLRVLHPFLALATGAVVFVTAGLVRTLRPHARVHANVTTALFVLQFSAGILDVTLLAPVWLQLVHLMLADATFIALVIVAMRVREGGDEAAVPASEPSTTPAAAA